MPTPEGLCRLLSTTARVSKGEELVLFLEHESDGVLVPWGLKQSVMPVVRNAETRQLEVTRDNKDVWIRPELLEGERPFTSMPLAELKRRVRDSALAGKPQVSQEEGN